MLRIVLFIVTLSVSSMVMAEIGSVGVCDDPDGVGFYLFPNPSNISDVDQLFHMNKTSVDNSRYNKGKKVILLVHGFLQDYTQDFPTVAIQAYFTAKNRENIVAVDWGKLSGADAFCDVALLQDIATLPLYIDVVSNVPVVGKRLAEFIMFLQENGYVESPDKVHLIGHSLGAHISGIAGGLYKEAMNTSLARITGTDPAGPRFQGRPPNERLDNTDADFVDIVHTNQEVLGYCGALGDVDFFVNGGGPLPQPGCEWVPITDPACSHNMAPLFYAESITNNTLMAQRPGVSNWTQGYSVVFGEFCPASTRGLYDIQLILPRESLGELLNREFQEAHANAVGFFQWIWSWF